MALRKFLYNKLIRDKLTSHMESTGSKVHKKPLSDDEFKQELFIKFLEEAQEVNDAKTKDDLIEELGDILEVIDALCHVYDFSVQDIQKAQEKKRENRGAFMTRTFVTIVEHEEGSYGANYCLSHPDKYPEVKN